MYYREGMEKRLRKGEVGEAIFREWFNRKLGEFCSSRGYVLEQQGFNPGGFVDVGEKRHLKETSDPDFALYPKQTRKPIVGISINTQEKFYTADSAMGKGCIKCPRAYSCHNGNERNLWFNKYNLSDYAKFEEKFNVETCMVTLFVSVDSVARWIERKAYEDLTHAYIFDGGRTLTNAQKEQLKEFLNFLRHGQRKGWERRLEIRWMFRSELTEITPERPSAPQGKIPFWTTGGRVERGRPRPVCCVNAKHARDEKELIDHITSLASRLV